MTREEVKIAKENFVKRKARNAKVKQIDNARLPVGAPMYFYCRFCGEHTDTQPELYLCTPKTICIPCQKLHELGEI